MTHSNNKPVIACCVRTYLPLSQTFVYEEFRNLRRSEPLVLARTVENLGLFPLDHVYSLPDRRWTWKWFVDLVDRRVFNMISFERLLKKKKAKLIHSHFGPGGFWALPLKRKLELPMVTTFHGYDMSQIAKQQEWKVAYHFLFSEGDLFLVEGNNMGSKLIEMGCPAEKIKIQHLGVDVGKFEYVNRELVSGDKVVILFVGRLVEKKGVQYALRALSLLCSCHKNIELRIVGEGDLRSSIERLIEELNIGEYVIMLGGQPNWIVKEEMRRAHIMVAPSVIADDGDSEGGAPTVLLEAQASGLPVVSTFHADIPEVVVDGRSGFLVPERDPEALTEKLSYLIENPDCWITMGMAGRRHIEKNYNIYRLVENLERLYESLLEVRS